MKVSADNLVRFFGGMRFPAWDLFHVERFRIQREDLAIYSDGRLRTIAEPRTRLVTMLNFTRTEINRISIQSEWCSCLKPPNVEAEFAQVST